MSCIVHTCMYIHAYLDFAPSICTAPDKRNETKRKEKKKRKKKKRKEKKEREKRRKKRKFSSHVYIRSICMDIRVHTNAVHTVCTVPTFIFHAEHTLLGIHVQRKHKKEVTN